MNRSQIAFTKARGRDVVFWQSHAPASRPAPTCAHPSPGVGIAELEIVVDSHEQYAYRFSGQRVRTVKRALPCGAPTRRGMDLPVPRRRRRLGRHRARLPHPAHPSGPDTETDLDQAPEAPTPSTAEAEPGPALPAWPSRSRQAACIDCTCAARSSRVRCAAAVSSCAVRTRSDSRAESLLRISLPCDGAARVVASFAPTSGPPGAPPTKADRRFLRGRVRVRSTCTNRRRERIPPSHPLEHRIHRRRAEHASRARISAAGRGRRPVEPVRPQAPQRPRPVLVSPIRTRAEGGRCETLTHPTTRTANDSALRRRVPGRPPGRYVSGQFLSEVISWSTWLLIDLRHPSPTCRRRALPAVNRRWNTFGRQGLTNHLTATVNCQTIDRRPERFPSGRRGWDRLLSLPGVTRAPFGAHQACMSGRLDTLIGG